MRLAEEVVLNERLDLPEEKPKHLEQPGDLPTPRSKARTSALRGPLSRAQRPTDRMAASTSYRRRGPRTGQLMWKE
jgi:hypothetical protein